MVGIILLLSFVVLLLTLSITINIILVRKSIYLLDNLDNSEKFIEDISEDLKHTYEYIKSIDNMQMFEKDDEVGVVFSDMVAQLEKLQNYYYDKNKESSNKLAVKDSKKIDSQKNV